MAPQPASGGLDSNSMAENPYQSPRTVREEVSAESVLRRQARLSFRLSAVILLLPALYNSWAFDAHAVSRLPGDLANLVRAIHGLGFIGGGLLIWFLGVPSLETMARLVRVVFANGIDRTAWQQVLYRALGRTVYLAIPGAALWLVWVFGFYQMRLDYHAISWALGVPAHLLAACLYVPLIYQWYRLAACRSARTAPQN